jgi:hypothetical protein
VWFINGRKMKESAMMIWDLFSAGKVDHTWVDDNVFVSSKVT